MFHFSDSLLIGTFLLVLMTSVADCNGQIPVTRGKRIKKTRTSMKDRSKRPPQNPFTAMSSLERS